MKKRKDSGLFSQLLSSLTALRLTTPVLVLSFRGRRFRCAI